MRTQNIYLPAGYEPDKDESYYAAPRLSEFAVQCLVNDTKGFIGHDWRGDIEFKRINTVQFVGWCFGHGAAIGETVRLVFYSWKRPGCAVIAQPKTTKFATLWLGTWHHAPLIAWTGGILAVGEDPRIKVDFLPKYTDLIH